MTKYDSNNLWFMAALLVVTGCGPIAPSVSKIGAPSSSSSSSVAASETGNVASLFGSRRITLEINESSSQSFPLMVEETTFVSGIKPRSRTQTASVEANSPFEQLISDSFYGQMTVSLGHRLEIDDDSPSVSALNSGQESVTIDASALATIEPDSKIYLVIEMSRLPNQIPSEDALPAAHITVLKTGQTGRDRGQRLTLSFSEMASETQDTRAHFFQDINRIFIFLSKK